MVATSLTIGIGGSGRVFAPSMFVGAMAGTAFGTVAPELFPSLGISPGAHGLVGMAAVFAGASHAPIAALVIRLSSSPRGRVTSTGDGGGGLSHGCSAQHPGRCLEGLGCQAFVRSRWMRGLGGWEHMCCRANGPSRGWSKHVDR